MALNMERIVREITQQFVDKLPTEQEFYTPEDLRDLDLPDFVIERVVIDMNQNLSDSIVPPFSEWADMSDSSVQDAWSQFLDAIVEELRMPATYAKSLFETAVADTLELAIQPREMIPLSIFGTENTLTLMEIQENVKYITVNKHLSNALIRYMQRKEKNKLTLYECKFLIEKIDQKLTNNYNPLNWAQILEPVFELAGPSVDTNLFRIFFEDKGKNRIARAFDFMNGSLNRTAFIEVLTSPDLLNKEGYDEDEPSLFEASGEKNGSSKPKNSGKTNNDNSSGQGENLNPEDKLDQLGLAETWEQVIEPEESEENDDMDEYKSFSDVNDSNEDSDKPDSTSEVPDASSILGMFHKRRSVRYFDDEDESEAPAENKELSSAESEEENEPDQSGTTAGKPAEKESESEIDDEEHDSLHKRFMFDADSPLDEDPAEEEPEEPAAQETEEKTSIYKELNLSQEEDEQDDDHWHDLLKSGLEKGEFEELNSVFSSENSRNAAEDSSEESEEWIINEIEKPQEEDDENYIKIEADESEAPPMWQAFLDQEEIDLEDSVFERVEETDEEKPEDEEEGDDFDDIPIYKISGLKREESTKISGLKSWLEDDKSRFVYELFNKSEQTYEKALNDLVEFDDWKNASKYIENEIFVRNMIDVYDEVAVDFTDRLHTFFLEIKSSQKNG
ncbi:MAG: hypothetical protein WD008_02030 [Balneolaceae bacterium]